MLSSFSIKKLKILNFQPQPKGSGAAIPTGVVQSNQEIRKIKIVIKNIAKKFKT